MGEFFRGSFSDFIQLGFGFYGEVEVLRFRLIREDERQLNSFHADTLPGRVGHRLTHPKKWPIFSANFSPDVGEKLKSVTVTDLTLPTRRYLVLRADVERNLGGVEIDEAADPVIRNAAKFGPVAESTDRGFATSREDPASAEADNVGELRSDTGSGNVGRIHAPGEMSTPGASGRTMRRPTKRRRRTWE